MTARAAAVFLALAAQAAAPAAAPHEPVPEGFAGQVYVDSAGCAFHRADLGGRTIWAQRLDAAGAPLCGFEPSVQISAFDALPRIPPNRSGTVPAFPDPGLYLQLGAFRGTAQATRITRDLSALGYTLLRQDFPRWRVLFAGPFADEDAGAEARRDLRRRGFPDAFLHDTRAD